MDEKKGMIRSSIVLAPRGMLKESALAFKSLKKKCFLFFFRLAGIHRLVKFQATDEQEKKDILKHFKGAAVELAPNLPGPVADQPEKIIKNRNELMCNICWSGAPDQKPSVFSFSAERKYTNCSLYDYRNE
jgi:hypothetical protein